MTLVYHGSTQIVQHPICELGRENLDFGKGFYVTNIKEQAEDWARKVSDRHKLPPLLNVYSFEREAILSESRHKIFTAYDHEWFDFIVSSRNGEKPWIDLDYIEGGVANDRIIDSITLFIAGLITRETALQRLAMHQPNNQMCLLNQLLTDKYLRYEQTIKL